MTGRSVPDLNEARVLGAVAFLPHVSGRCLSGSRLIMARSIDLFRMPVESRVPSPDGKI